ncbi:hypothetical protein GH714_014458 [Hevea brasiliensis]|uniref:Rx N-terminal domain-containing protein n=1 Tax=Hevea brasiliensis TaxID=3981 RepID=A0A6A6N377_HEVBR|nr:hypothetical protein GH714_014458 [Hevea brasiliensis]
MAEMILSFMVDGTLSRVASLITEEIISARNLKDDLKGLQDSLIMIHDVLQDAEERQTGKETVKLWMKKLKDVAYDAEDVFDEKINDSLNKIKNEAIGFGLQVLSRDRIMPQMDLDQVTDSVLDNPVVGREADVFKIVNLLSCSSDQQVLTIVPINFREMLQTLNANTGGMTNKDSLLQRLEKELENKKFLLVLDDVWNNESERWNELKTRLIRINRNSGNTILVTTRSEKVASIVETSTHFSHTLNLLSDDECWSIMKERAFGSEPIPLDLECIGKEIAKKCGGVP